MNLSHSPTLDLPRPLATTTPDDAIAVDAMVDALVDVVVDAMIDEPGESDDSDVITLSAAPTFSTPTLPAKPVSRHKSFRRTPRITEAQATAMALAHFDRQRLWSYLMWTLAIGTALATATVLALMKMG